MVEHIRAQERERCAKALEQYMPDARCSVSLQNAAAIIRAMPNED